MIPYMVAFGAFAAAMLGALAGLWISRTVPHPYRDKPTHDAIKLATEMLSVLAALVLGLLTTSIRETFETINNQVDDFSARLVMLDQTLHDIGPQAAAARDFLRRYTALSIQQNWPTETGGQPRVPTDFVASIASISESLGGYAHTVWFEGADAAGLLDSLRLAVIRLPADGQIDQILRGSAIQTMETLLQMRWSLHERTQSPILPGFVLMLIFWMTAIFLSYGYNAPGNAVVITAFGLAAVALAASFFMIIEMDMPFQGVMRISSHAMRDALQHMSR